uniref:DDT domain-containing protein n=1 Tax=Rodentolepis nana TaxID=102285 RepID=A0A0R3TTN8_RODNA
LKQGYKRNRPRQGEPRLQILQWNAGGMSQDKKIQVQQCQWTGMSPDKKIQVQKILKMSQDKKIQKAIELKKELQIDDKPKSLSLPMNPLADTDVVCCTKLLDYFRKTNTPPEQMRSLALETINVNYPADQWLQVFTDGYYIENQANASADVYSELFSFYAAVGHNRSAFEGEIEAIRIAP